MAGFGAFSGRDLEVFGRLRRRLRVSFFDPSIFSCMGFFASSSSCLVRIPDPTHPSFLVRSPAPLRPSCHVRIPDLMNPANLVGDLVSRLDNHYNGKSPKRNCIPMPEIIVTDISIRYRNRSEARYPHSASDARQVVYIGTRIPKCTQQSRGPNCRNDSCSLFLDNRDRRILNVNFRPNYWL